MVFAMFILLENEKSKEIGYVFLKNRFIYRKSIKVPSIILIFYFFLII